ncbi:MAG: SUMF1/EgtB/PvdO family nonheme iron enzyme [bacterium]|nr:SUMF1/EgtB/PvdO family nonheme iron enzyme [bacterium]
MKIQRIISILFLCLFLIVPVWAQSTTPPPLLVITDLRTLGDEASVAEAQAFSEFIRTEVERTGAFRIITKNSMLAVFKAKKFSYPCYELPCFVRMGRLLGADQVLAGHLHRKQGLIELTLRLVDVNKGLIIRTAYRNPPTLSQEALLGDWGENLIAEALDIDPGVFDAAQTPAEPAAEKQAIPKEVLNKYPGMIYIPAGQCVIGSNDGDVVEQPVHTVDLEAFYLGKYEVTNQEYMDFVKAEGHRPPLNWIDGEIPIGLEKHPVSFISFEDAEAYCQWKGGRLPTEEEWEYAAKSDRLRTYPWGDKFDVNRANTWEAKRENTAPVGSYPFGASPFGVEDMAGNVFEWTSSFFTAYPGSSYKISESKTHYRVLRGGSWNFNQYYARCSMRLARPGGERSRSFGMRLARNAQPLEP